MEIATLVSQSNRKLGERLWAKYITLALIIGIFADLVLVLVIGGQSISSRVWDATAAHPTLIAAGMLGSVYLAYQVRDHRGLLYFLGALTGHLFVHS